MRVGSGSVPSCVHVARVYRFVSLVLDATFCRPVLGFVCDPGRHLGGVPCFFRPCLLCPRLAFVRGPQFLPHSPDSLSSACPRRPPNACSTTRKANKHTTMPETCHMRCNAVCGASCGSRFAVVSYRHTAGLANGRASSLFFFPTSDAVRPSVRPPARPTVHTAPRQRPQGMLTKLSWKEQGYLYRGPPCDAADGGDDANAGEEQGREQEVSRDGEASNHRAPPEGGRGGDGTDTAGSGSGGGGGGGRGETAAAMISPLVVAAPSPSSTSSSPSIVTSGWEHATHGGPPPPPLQAPPPCVR